MLWKMIAWGAVVCFLLDLFKLTEIIERKLKSALNNLRKDLKNKDSQLNFFLLITAGLISLPFYIVVPVALIAWRLDIFSLEPHRIIDPASLYPPRFDYYLSRFIEKFTWEGGISGMLSLALTIWLTIYNIVIGMRLAVFFQGILSWAITGLVWAAWAIFYLMATYRKGFIWIMGFIFAVLALYHETFPVHECP